MSECPHSLAERETAVADGMCPLCMSAQREALMASSAEQKITDDIAALIERARKTAQCVYLIGDAGPCADVSDCITQLAEALHTLAQENARVEAIRADIQQCNESLAQENERLKAGLDAQLRDAIRAETIEECLAKLPEDTPAYVCAAIRALAQTDEPHPSSLMGHVERKASSAATDADLPTAEDVRGILKD